MWRALNQSKANKVWMQDIIVIVYGSESLNAQKVEEGILRRKERTLIRNMRGMKLLSDRKNIRELKERLGHLPGFQFFFDLPSRFIPLFPW